VYGIAVSKKAAKRENWNNLSICHAFQSAEWVIRSHLGKTFPATCHRKVKVLQTSPCTANAAPSALTDSEPSVVVYFGVAQSSV
jgi:hypothetical protein